MEIKFLEANRDMFGGKRPVSSILYLIYHYTANRGDSAKGNANYFSRKQPRIASAHYFVDNNEIYQSVPDDYVAYSVGGNIQSSHHPLYGIATNYNTLNIEMCCNADGQIDDTTIQNAQALGKMLCDKYGITPDRVHRHYDVNGKLCPNTNNLLSDDVFREFVDGIFGKHVGIPSMSNGSNITAPDSYIQVYTKENGWHPIVKNLDDFAGYSNWPIRAIALKADCGKLTYRVHQLGRGWLPTVTGFDINDFNNGYAGDKEHEIDGLQVYFDTDTDKTYGHYFQARYQVQTSRGGAFLPTVIDTNWEDGDGRNTAGTFGEPICKVYFHLG